MTNIKSKIMEISNVFKNIYRITLENKMVVDIYENISPSIGSLFSYEIFNKINDNKYIGTEMSGHIYKTTQQETYVSFGGLLSKIPKVFEYEDKNLVMRYNILIPT
jgi:hypothetical protein